jgi:hypothetical protein
MRNGLRIAIVLALLMVAPAVAVAGGQRTYAINCLREQYKPRAIVLTCADGGILVDQLKWSHWSRTKAVASGAFVWNDCKPSCVNGHFHARPVKVTLSGPESCPGHVHPAFGRAAFTYPDGGPPFRFRRTTFVCP